MNAIESISYITYEYNVYPRIVEKHASSNIVKTTLNGANIRITLDSNTLKYNNIILYKINIINEGNIIAKNIKIINTLNNITFIKGSLCINGNIINNYNVKDGFLFKYLKPKDNINISFKIKSTVYGDIANIVSGFYYFINNKNHKIYRKILSNLNKITLNYSDLLFDIKYNSATMNLNNNKNICAILKNIGNKEAKKIKFNILLPTELKLDYENIFIEQKNILANDKYGFFLGNLKQNQSCKINFNIKFLKFNGRYIVPFVIYCSYYNLSEKNLYEKFDSKILKFSVNLMPNTIKE